MSCPSCLCVPMSPSAKPAVRIFMIFGLELVDCFGLLVELRIVLIAVIVLLAQSSLRYRLVHLDFRNCWMTSLVVSCHSSCIPGWSWIDMNLCKMFASKFGALQLFSVFFFFFSSHKFCFQVYHLCMV